RWSFPRLKRINIASPISRRRLSRATDASTFLVLTARGRSRIKTNGAWSAVHRRPNKRPDRFDLLHIEHAAPRRHLSLGVEHRIVEAMGAGRTERGGGEGGAAAGVAHLVAGAMGAVVPVNGRARRDLCVGGPGTIRRDCGEREQKPRDVQR